MKKRQRHLVFFGEMGELLVISSEQDEKMRKPLFTHSVIVKLVRLLDMLYMPEELADEIDVNVDTIYRCYLPAGCPHRRDDKNHIWINGVDFKGWVKDMLEKKKRARNNVPMPEGQAFCMRCKKRVDMLNPQVIYSARHNEMLQGRCAECNTKVNRARSSKSNHLAKSQKCCNASNPAYFHEDFLERT